jgi:microcystin-dependent protein
MSDQFVGEIRIVGFNFAPRGWAFCNGTIMAIRQNTALFSLLGTNYGGDGRVTFALPNLQGAATIGAGQGPGLTERVVGEAGGSATVALIAQQIPIHTHVSACNSAGNQSSPSSHACATAKVQRQTINLYSSTTNAAMNAASQAVVGGSQPHNNMPPHLALNFCIALQGIYPPRS